MKKYRFKLQAVLDYRADQLDVVQQKVAREEAIRNQILQRIAEYDQLITTAFDDQQRALQHPELDLVQASNFPNYLFRLKQSRAEESDRLRAQEQKMLAIREELKQALIKKKSLDLLKEKDQLKYNQAIVRHDEAFLEEIALNQYHRNKAQIN